MVAGWVQDWTPLIYESASPEIKFDVLLRNSGESPVYDFLVEVAVPGVTAGSAFLFKNSLPPGEIQMSGRLLSVTELNPGIPGHKSWVVDQGKFAVALTFRDSSNRCWRREQSGLVSIRRRAMSELLDHASVR